MNLRVWFVIGVLLTIAIGVGGWVTLYPSPNDPKNMRYVLWKAGLCSLDLGVATGTMIGDPQRDKLVIGKTDEQLQRRFGRLLEESETQQYFRDCFQSSPWKGQEVRFIQNSPWMVVFREHKATNLILLKGC